MLGYAAQYVILGITLSLSPLGLQNFAAQLDLCIIYSLIAEQRKIMKRTFIASTWQEGSWFVAQCLEVDIASQGETEAEALANLGEALSLHFELPVATIIPKIKTLEVEVCVA